MEVGNFLDSYDVIDSDFLTRAHPQTEEPNLIVAEKNGVPLLIKYWPRCTDLNDSDLEDIWLHELRQLHRLKGYPGVGDYISSIIDSDKDKHGFYLVLDAAGRIPLSYLTQIPRTLSLQKHWIKRLKDIHIRVLFWKNIARIVRAIGLLHAQGLLHRNLDSNSILSSPDIHSEAVDFQLTGFEWSVRVYNLSSVPIEEEEILPDSKIYSFTTDWASLGGLLIKLLEIDIGRLKDLNTPVDVIVERTGLTLSEVHLIRALIGVTLIKSNTPQEALNAKLIESSVEQITESLEEISSRHVKPFHIVINLNNQSSKNALKHIIQKKYQEKFGVILSDTDTDEMKGFVVQDLSDSPVAIFCQGKDSNNGQLFLQGKELVYELEKFQPDFYDPSFTTWKMAFCQRANLNLPNQVNSHSPAIEINSENVVVYLMSEAKQQYRADPDRLHGRSWEDILNSFDNKDNELTPEQTALLEGLAACHLTEISYARSEIYPVKITDFSQGEDGLWNVSVVSAQHEDAEALSKSLGINAPSVRLEQMLVKNDGDNETITWSLVSNALLAKEDDGEVILSYQNHDNTDGEIVYTFTSNRPDPLYKQYFIAPNSLQGTFRQLSRRAKALDTLSIHAELMGAISNPQQIVCTTQDTVIEDGTFKQLDDSKQNTLKNILATMPIYLVQGPPGVGKTHLVTKLVSQIFEKEQDSRILLSAQNHSTVQHLYDEIEKIGLFDRDNSQDTLIIRCNKQERDDDSALVDADIKAKDYLSKLINSRLFEQSTSQHLKHEILSIFQGDRSKRYTLINQLFNAANIVFSTTNSEQIERMIKSRAQFDWSIMEETSKATGVELLSPLLLSHRRLMIGDHKQLPPYRSIEMKKILLDPSKLNAVIRESEQISNFKIRGEICKNLLENVNTDESNLRKIGSSAAKNMMLFESLIIDEEEDTNNHKKLFGSMAKKKPIGSMLSVQYRMHPYIAELVSDVFYDGKLTTAPEKESFYLNSAACKPFYFSTPEVLKQSAPVVWIDMPDLQSTKGMTQGEALPRWHNETECKAVIELLKRLQRSEPEQVKPLKLAVLSPYAEQVSRIQKALKKTPLANLRQFASLEDGSNFCSTVDGFQGDEADLVIISLVRNNDKGTLRSALGFLIDERRMNVLLSRSRYQLVLVGSYNFLKSWSNKLSTGMQSTDEEGQFLIRLVNKLEHYLLKNKMTLIPWQELGF